MYKTFFKREHGEYITKEGFKIPNKILMENPHEIIENTGWVETKLPLSIEKLANKMQENNVKIVFGLEQQKHIETIERILSELGSNEYAWEKIGKEIGWCPKTACYHYVSYLRKLVFSA